MKLFLILLMASSSVFAQINSVNSGSVIQAAKLNELITKINELSNKVVSLEQKILPVGSLVHSLLTLNQFKLQNGDCWRALDGLATGVSDELRTQYGYTTIPDGSGRFLRNTGGLAAGLGLTQEDSFQGHWHGYQRSGNPSVSTASTNQLSAWTQSYQGLNSDAIRDAVTDGVNGAPRTGSETKPKNLSVNIFIKFKTACNF